MFIIIIIDDDVFVCSVRKMDCGSNKVWWVNSASDGRHFVFPILGRRNTRGHVRAVRSD